MISVPQKSRASLPYRAVLFAGGAGSETNQILDSSLIVQLLLHTAHREDICSLDISTFYSENRMGYIKHIAIALLTVVFILIIITALPTVSQKEGFSVKKARDCSCDPGSVPQKCGDTINYAGEFLNGCARVPKDSYFCQAIQTPEVATTCA